MINGVSKLSRMNFEFPCSTVKVKSVTFGERAVFTA
jgi:hypothetical protein